MQKIQSYCLDHQFQAESSFLDVFADVHTLPDALELYRPQKNYYVGWEAYNPNIKAYFGKVIKDIGLSQLTDEDNPTERNLLALK